MTCRTASLLSLPAIGILAAVALWWSPLNQDEGWYLIAAQRVSQGYQPYLDYAFTQPPVFPTFYQLSLPLVQGFGVAGARLFTLSLAAASVLLMMRSLRATAPAYAVPLGILLLLLLTGLNPGYLQFSSTVKTYSLAGLFLTGAVCLRLKASVAPSPMTYLLCGVCCALATGTRMSLAGFAVALLIELILHRREVGLPAAGWFAVGGVVTLFVLLAPFLALAPEGFLFGLWEYHTGRALDNGWLTRGALLLRWLRGWLPAVIALGLLWPKRRRFLPTSTAVLWGVGLVTLIHLFAPFPYDEYQTMLLPPVALVIALEVPRALPGNLRRKAPGFLLLVSLLFAATSPVIESWFAGERDRLWWPMKSDSDLWRLKEAAAVLDLHDPDGTLLLTMDAYLAVEAGRDVPRGLEMGPFSYFPELSTERAERLHVLNMERAERLLLDTSATAAALSGYGFTIQSPALTPTPREQLDLYRSLIEERYRFAEAWPAGQDNSVIRIYTKP